MIDRLGVKVKPGDFVAYAGQAGRCAVLHIGRVIDIVDREPDYYNQKPYQKVKVELLEEGFGEVPFSTRKTGKPKIVYLTYPERLVVVNNYVPNGH